MNLAITDGGKIYAGDEDGLPAVRLGRDIYNSRSLTSLNRSPIDDLTSLIVAGAEKSDSVDITGIAKSLLVDGSLVYSGAGFVPDVYAHSADSFVEYIRDDDGELDVYAPDGDLSRLFSENERWYTLTGAGWGVVLVRRKSDGTVEAEAQIEGTFPAETFTVFPQGGRGLLYWAQDTYQRIEDIALTMRRVMSGSNLLPIISGDVPDSGKLKAAVATAKQFIGIPGDIRLDRVISESVINQLKTEQDALIDQYYDALHVVDTASEQQRPSGKDRELRMKAMFQFVRYMREVLTQILGTFGISPVFDKLVIASAQERIQELDVLDRIRGVIGEDEYTRRVRML